MNIRDRIRGHFMSDDLDPSLGSLLRTETREVDPARVARARARVAAQLKTDVPRSPWRRRLALSGLGGGGFWIFSMGSAAASKGVAAAVGLSLLVGAAAVSEGIGIGAAVRETVRNAVVHDDSTDAEGQAEVAGGASVAVASGTTVPGNLITRVGPNDRFQLRAEVVGAVSALLTVSTGAGLLEINIEDAHVVVPGSDTNDPEWSSYVGYGVMVFGQCEYAGSAPLSAAGDPMDALASCEALVADRVQVLGQAGQGQPDGSGKPEGTGAPDGSGKPEGTGAPDGAGKPEGTGAPDGAGKPEGAGTPDGSGKPEGVGPAAG